jgi:hypothetical protein
MPAGWEVADPTGIRRVTSPLDARRPRAAAFAVDWAGHPAASQWLLVAVVSAPGDTVTAGSLPGVTLQDVVLGSHHVAVKRVELV